MSNYCQILIHHDFDFFPNKDTMVSFLKNKGWFNWEQDEYIHISFCRHYWRDVVKEMIGNNVYFDWVYVKNDCMDEGGFFTFEEFKKEGEDR